MGIGKYETKILFYGWRARELRREVEGELKLRGGQVIHPGDRELEEKKLPISFAKHADKEMRHALGGRKVC